MQVAKEAKDEENLVRGRAFHEQFARIQLDASLLAARFNQRLRVLLPVVAQSRQWHVSFLPVFVYQCFDITYAGNTAWVLVEPELDGKFTKWNNNAGAVLRSIAPTRGRDVVDSSSYSELTVAMSSLGLGDINENEEEEEEDDGGEMDVQEVPQAFSHYSFEASDGKQLVCDLQGTWNSADGFILTDPVVHYVSKSGRKHTNGATDKGSDGVIKFFKTHVCGILCTSMGLKKH